MLSGELILEQRKGDPFGPALHFFVNIDRNGHLMMVDADHPDMAMRPASAAFLTEDAGDEVDLDCWNEELKFYVYAALLTVSFMHCKNVDVIEHHPPDGPSRRNLRRNGRALTTYKILDIEPMRRVLARDGHAETGGLASAMHICRGHFKTFTADAPLFGRLVGPYWWADHVRGDSAHGFALKDYRVRIQGGEFGRSYGQADETQPASPRQVGCDPDRSGRGHVAHAVTQNRLADAVCHAGYEPRSPTPDEPQFDVGWSTPDAIWLCKVKSLTAQNELSADTQGDRPSHRLRAPNRR